MQRGLVFHKVSPLAILIGLASAAQGTEVALTDVPKPVLETVKTRFADIKIVEAAEEKNEQGQQIYEFKLDNKGMNIDATLTPEGSLVLIEKQVEREALPEAVAKALEAKFAKARYRLVEEVFEVKDKQETLARYEVVLITPKKQIRAVELEPQGKILRIEKRLTEEED